MWSWMHGFIHYRDFSHCIQSSMHLLQGERHKIQCLPRQPIQKSHHLFLQVYFPLIFSVWHFCKQIVCKQDLIIHSMNLHRQSHHLQGSCITIHYPAIQDIIYNLHPFPQVIVLASVAHARVLFIFQPNSLWLDAIYTYCWQLYLK